MKLKVNVSEEKEKTSLTFMASRHCDNVRAVIFNFFSFSRSLHKINSSQFSQFFVEGHEDDDDEKIEI